MSLSSHIEELKSKHRKLDTMLAQEQKSYAASEQSLAAMKKEKLLLKDKIEMLTTSSGS